MARNGICICMTLDYIRKWISERNSDSKSGFQREILTAKNRSLRCCLYTNKY